MKKILKILLVIITIIPFINVSAKEDIEITDILVIDKSENASVENIETSKNIISPHIIFEKIGDYVTLELVIDNKSNSDYHLTGIDNKTEDSYITADSNSYGSIIYKNTQQTIQVTLTYVNELQNQEELTLDDESYELRFSNKPILENPNTGMVYGLIIMVVAICAALSYLAIHKKKKIAMVPILLLMISIPVLVKAYEEINITFTIEKETVKGRFLDYDVILDNDGELFDSFTVTYGQEIEELPTPTKEGYNFRAWVDKAGLEVSADTVIFDFTYLKAEYTPVEYTISYNLEGGTLSKENPSTYTIEDEIELRNPEKTGYNFQGWKEGENTTIQSEVSIPKGTKGNKVYTAVYSQNPPAKYTVIHRKMDLNGSTYTEAERENLSGIIGTLVTPNPKSYTGFTSPASETKEILEDGTTTFTYNYTRNKYTLSFDSSSYISSSSTKAGTYYYGTTINLYAISRSGYSFYGWYKNSVSYASYSSSYSFTLTGNVSIYPVYKTTDPSSGCLSGEMEVEVYDKKKKKRKKKKLKDVTEDDLLLAWDFDRGEFVFVEPLWIKKIERNDIYTKVKFSDGSYLDVVFDHSIYNVDKGMFTKVIEETPIGTRTMNSKGEIITIVSKEVIKEEVTYCNIITKGHINFFANGILTSWKLSNLYPIENHKYVKDNREIRKQEDYPEIPEKWFEGLRVSESPKTIESLLSDIEHCEKNKKVS